MRIGIDMIAVQSPGSRGRGIGRYVESLLVALLAQDPDHHYFLYYYEGYPLDPPPTGRKVTPRILALDRAGATASLGNTIDRLAQANPDGLDLLLITSPFEIVQGYRPPPPPRNGLKLAALLYDLIPFLFPEQYLRGPLLRLLTGALQTLQHYDALLAISEATRADAETFLRVPQGRLFAIGSASDERFFPPEKPRTPSAAPPEALRSLGITRPYVFNVGGMDDRKNWRGLIAAFALLPPPLRAAHQLVITCAVEPAHVKVVQAHARSHGIADQLVLTGAVSDGTLRTLYQHCAVFAFPSFYEGFGLPLLEAMQCGAAVVAGRNSSQVEVVGEVGLLAQASDPADIARQLGRVLADPVLAARLGASALVQASNFYWAKTAARTLEAFQQVGSPTRGLPGRPAVPGRSKPRIAFFSPLPPQRSGIADYSARLLQELQAYYAIDLYHDPSYLPVLGFSSLAFGCYDARTFDRRATVVDYHAILYQMGNSYYHRYLYDILLRHPGIVTLHDFCLGDFFCWYAEQPGISPGYLLREIQYDCPERAASALALLQRSPRGTESIPERCNREGIYLNRRIFEHARAVILHDSWHQETMRGRSGELADRCRVIPQGATPRVLSANQRRAVRARFDLPPDALLFGSFGLLTADKLTVETVTAFAPVARAFPFAVLLFVGQDLDGGQTRARTVELGLQGQVRFLGHLPGDDFVQLASALDIGLGPRRPPTNGETSASLLTFLGAAIPSIVIDVGTFASYPDQVVCKIPWNDGVVDALTRAMLDLAEDPRRRARLGESALAHIAEHHDWPRVAALYVEVLEQCAARSSAARTPGFFSRGEARAG